MVSESEDTRGIGSLDKPTQVIGLPKMGKDRGLAYALVTRVHPR
jgi:hypothetical protein